VDPLTLISDPIALMNWVEEVGVEQASQDMIAACEQYRDTHSGEEVREMGQKFEWAVSLVEEFDP
jgi:hypothetical protein